MFSKIQISIVTILMSLIAASCAQSDSLPNEIATAGLDHSSVYEPDKVRIADPTIHYDGKLYYLYGTEPPPQVGFPVLVSDDLVQWHAPGSVEKRRVLNKGQQTYGDRGFWAPQVFQHKNLYYIAYTANENIAIAHSESPLGPFVQEEIMPLGEGRRQIDPFVFKDDDGKVYLYHVRLDKGNHIYVAQLEDDLSGIKPETLRHCITPQPDTWEDTQTFESAVVAEGPTVIKHNETYYLFYSANHFKSDDYAVGYATSSSPLGPWKRYFGNPIIDRDSMGADGTGHGDFFFGDDKQLFYVFHTHATATDVHPRATALVKAQFRNVGGGEDLVVVEPKSAYYLRKKQALK
ncbi:glycosyl hydrolase family 43 [Marinimicrobium koreense]|uniref:Glycosyl hydrolase family 43 n=1 Tax=Marinimicrobium koreense TaxID=306545 RepID=A0A3N1NZX9_9GAMM|nr:glycoside hydrolase family 43 protein [Marinimicrobium koreense]ROQ21713.1 glycosyl hydrolase family 43 [Marinimicrobium koreense]